MARFLIFISFASAFLLLNGANKSPGSITTTPINKQRLQLISTALGDWMTMRKNGLLMSSKSVHALFLKSILEKYRSSNFYRTFVIAFQHGILPRLTLRLGDTCDPRYRYPWNNTLTWHYLKKLTFEGYKNRYDINSTSAMKYCDYRLGLICQADKNYPTTGSCVCPPGSGYYYVYHLSQKLEIKWRCLMNPNEICSLIDLAHGNDPKHSSLASNLHQMIFNLDKPLGCKEGTQCRFKSDDLKTPKCYPTWLGSFYPPPPPASKETWTLPIGSECSIDLYADSGTCEVNTGQYGVLPGLVCYNFGPPKSSRHHVSSRLGFCAHEYGQYGVASVATSANGLLQYHPLFMPNVHPRSIPLREEKLLNYYTRFLTQVHSKYFLEGIQHEIGEPCHLRMTYKYKDIWNYYISVGKPPQYGREFNRDANERSLEDHLTLMIDVASDPQKGICRVYPFFHKNGPYDKRKLFEALECLPDGASGDFGKCVLAPDPGFLPFAETFQDFLDQTSIIQIELLNEERDYDETILRDNPEVFCKAKPSARHQHATPPNGDYCSPGFISYPDYGDHQKIYGSFFFCNLDPRVKLHLRCHDGSDGIDYEPCEAQQLNKMITQSIPMLESISTLGRDKTCLYVEDTLIRKWIREGKNGDINKYKMLVILDEIQETNQRFCDAKKLLECKQDFICGCVDTTAPRKEKDLDTGQMKESQQCYMTTGSCSGRDIDALIALTPTERKAVALFYGEGATPGDFCGANANFCVYFQKDREICRPSGNTREIGVRSAEFAGAPKLRPIIILTIFIPILINKCAIK